MKKIIQLIIKVLTLLVTIPLWFVKFFVGIGHLLNQDTKEIIEVRFYHSMYENLNDIGLGACFYISIFIVFCSAVFVILSTRTSNKKINRISDIIFIITMSSFFLFLLIASTVSRGY